MVWTGRSFKKHNKRLTPRQASRAAKQANAVLKRTGNKGLAIAIANKYAKRRRKR